MAFPEADISEPAALCAGVTAAVALIASGLPPPIDHVVAVVAFVLGSASLVAVVLGHAQALARRPRSARGLAWTAAAYLVFAALAWPAALWAPWPSAAFAAVAVLASVQAVQARRRQEAAPPPKAS